jgi:hemerythrin
MYQFDRLFRIVVQEVMMAFFNWKQEYSVGIKKIDDQHKVLVENLNELYESMQAGKGRETLAEVLDGLVKYTQGHFATEESLMKLYKYPGYEEHKQKHTSMKDHVLSLKQKYDDGTISNPIQITNFLKDWLKKHIMITDKAYSPFLVQKGVK